MPRVRQRQFRLVRRREVQPVRDQLGTDAVRPAAIAQRRFAEPRIDRHGGVSRVLDREAIVPTAPLDSDRFDIIVRRAKVPDARTRFIHDEPVLVHRPEQHQLGFGVGTVASDERVQGRHRARRRHLEDGSNPARPTERGRSVEVPITRLHHPGERPRPVGRGQLPGKAPSVVDFPWAGSDCALSASSGCIPGPRCITSCSSGRSSPFSASATNRAAQPMRSPCLADRTTRSLSLRTSRVSRATGRGLYSAGESRFPSRVIR